MIDHDHFSGIKFCDIALAILAVYRDQQFRFRQLRDVLHRDLQIIDHLQQIGFLHSFFAAVNKTCINILLFQIPHQSISAGQCIRIRIVMTLYHDITIIDQILQMEFHKLYTPR